MSMSKQDFIALANKINEHNHVASSPANDLTPFTSDQLETLGDFCRRQNSNFMRERWIGYIKGENGPSGGSIRKVA